jgi:hypothetical protein
MYRLNPRKIPLWVAQGLTLASLIATLLSPAHAQGTLLQLNLYAVQAETLGQDGRSLLCIEQRSISANHSRCIALVAEGGVAVPQGPDMQVKGAKAPVPPAERPLLSRRIDGGDRLAILGEIDAWAARKPQAIPAEITALYTAIAEAIGLRRPTVAADAPNDYAAALARQNTLGVGVSRAVAGSPGADGVRN